MRPAVPGLCRARVEQQCQSRDSSSDVISPHFLKVRRVVTRAELPGNFRFCNTCRIRVKLRTIGENLDHMSLCVVTQLLALCVSPLRKVQRISSVCSRDFSSSLCTGTNFPFFGAGEQGTYADAPCAKWHSQSECNDKYVREFLVQEVLYLNPPVGDSRLPSAVTDIFTIKILNSILAEIHTTNE